MMDKLSLRQKQMDRAMSMLRLSSDWQPEWKLLVYDNIGQNILNPLLSLDKLRSNNITLHLSINSVRDPIPDVSAIYFLMPTTKNIDRVCKDLKDRLYDSYYLNFISPISRTQLESIAEAAMSSHSATNVKKIYDRYLDFITLEDDLFILRKSEKHSISLYAINRPDASEQDVSETIDCIVCCLFSVIITLGSVPVIRCPKGGPAEMIARSLDKKIRQALSDDRNGLFKSEKSKQRNRFLLCLVDRTIDMSTPLHHAWTYQALVHDCLDNELNKVQMLEEDSETGKLKIQLYELDPSDKFWSDHKGSPFPQVADAIQQGIEECKKSEEHLKTNIDNDDDIGLSESKCKSSASTIPELSEHKRILKKHTTIAAAVLNEIKHRKLDNFFEIEEKIMNRNVIDRVALDEMITDTQYGRLNDKYRLFLISYICDNPELTEDEAEKYVNILEELGCNRSVFDFLKQWKSLSRSNVAQLQSSLQSSGGILKTANMFSKLMSKGSKFVMEGVKNLVLKEHYLPLTKIIDGLMNSSSSNRSRESLQYLYFDPTSVDHNPKEKISHFRDAILFVIGGGNYVEYQNLVDYCNSKSRSMLDPTSSPRIIYGSTDLMNSDQFLRQLGRLRST